MLVQVEAPTPTGTLVLYGQTVGAVGSGPAPLVNTGNFITGNYVFTQMPVYMSYSPSGPSWFANPTAGAFTGTTFFDAPGT